jgi:hypothetical protein
MTAWNNFVKKIYHEGHSSDKNYSFKQALKDASARKSEMGKPNLAMGVKSKSTKNTSRKSRKSKKSRKTKKNRSRRQRK